MISRLLRLFRNPLRKPAGTGRRDQPLSHFIGLRYSEPSSENLRQLIEACKNLPDGTRCDTAIYRLIEEEMAARRIATGTQLGPGNPRVSGLVVKRSGLPDWWSDGDNLLLVGADVSPEITVKLGLLLPPPTGSVAIIGSVSRPGEWALSGNGALFVVGDGSIMPSAVITVRDGSATFVGERANAISPIAMTAMNGGIIVVGADSLWAGEVIILTDDFHAIRDRHSGKRLNGFGGRVVIDRHVWLAMQVNLLGDCYIGHDSVVGIGSIVRNAALPAHCVAAGRPAEVVREDIVWSIDDLP